MGKQKTVKASVNIFTAIMELPDKTTKTITAGADEGETMVKAFKQFFPNAVTLSTNTEKCRYELTIDDVIKYGTPIIESEDK